MKYRMIAVDYRDGVCRISLSGQPLGSREAGELGAIAADLVEDRALRAVLLDSVGPHFCPGPSQDLEPLLPGADPTVSLAAVRAPVVALLHGQVSSVGLELALVADVRLAHPDTRFSMPQVNAGQLPCWGGTQRLPRVIGAPAAMYFLLFGEEIDGQRALHLGLVHDVADSPAERANDLLRLWAQRGPLALEYAKEAVLHGAELPLREGLGLEADLNTLLQVSADRAEGIAAFFDKRPPRFAGR